MPRTNFETLEVYRLAERLADSIWPVVREWDPFARRTVGAQLVRAVDSISANIAESNGRGTTKDRRHFLLVARGSLYETQNWLRRAYRRDLLTAEQVEHIRPMLEALTPMLNAYIRTFSPATAAPKPEAQSSKL